MRWLLTTPETEFSSWSPLSIGSYLPNVSLPTPEPSGAIHGDGWSVLPLTDNPPTPPADRYISTRYIRVDPDKAVAIYQTKAKTAEMIAADRDGRMPAIMAERDRRIEAGFPFLGKVIQSRPEDRENIIGASVLAGQALAFANAQPGDLRWHGGDSDFTWITADNSTIKLDVLTTIELGRVAAAHKSGLIFAAKALKERVDAGEVIPDITADALWG